MMSFRAALSACVLAGAVFSSVVPTRGAQFVGVPKGWLLAGKTPNLYVAGIDPTVAP